MRFLWLQLSFTRLLDPVEPPVAATIEEIGALVVSRESLAGAHAVQRMRADRGVSTPLALVVVELVGGKGPEPKLGSSGLRAREVARAARSRPDSHGPAARGDPG